MKHLFLLITIIIATLPIRVFAETPSVMEKIGGLLSPFWSLPESQDTFQFTLEIPVTNDGDIPVMPMGKVFLTKMDGTILTRIDAPIVDAFGGRRIQDYLTMNPEQSIIHPGETRVFSVVWHGFVDQYISNGVPVVTHHHPKEMLGGDHDQVQFWQKLVPQTESIPLRATVELTYQGEGNTLYPSQNQDIPITLTYDRLVAVPNTGLLIILALLAGIIVGLIFTRNAPIKKDGPSLKNTLDFETFEALARQASQQPKKSPKKAQKERKTRASRTKKSSSKTPSKRSTKINTATDTSPATTKRTKAPKKHKKKTARPADSLD